MFLTGSPNLEQESSHKELAKYVHQLLTALLTGQGQSYRKIHGPFEYVLVLAMYVKNGNFHEPIAISRYCAMQQYVMRVIVVHIMRLGGLEADYTPLAETAAVEKENQNEDDIGEPQDNPLLPPDVVPLPEGLELELPDSIMTGAHRGSIENPLLLDDDDEIDNKPKAIDSWKSSPSSSINNFVNPMDIRDDEEELGPLTDDGLNDLLQDDLLTLVFYLGICGFTNLVCF